MTQRYNRPETKSLRRHLRRERPTAEAIVWSRLRGRQLLGLKFRRQFGVGPYCLDFYCPEIRLAIEIDGDTHSGDEAVRSDQARQRWIEGFGITFHRFTNEDVYENLDGLLEAVAASTGR